MANRRSWLVIAGSLTIGLLGACKESPSRSSTARPSTDGSAAASAATTAAVPTAAGSSALRQMQPRDVDLLAWTDAKVVVSSKVDNPHDFPEHLCDGKVETAWNGKTGDLHASIGVELPPGAEAHALGIIVGYDLKTSKTGAPEQDLFTMNYRIRKIRILREKAKPVEFELDPNRREMQRLNINLAGRFKIEVLDAVPGTQKNWKEIVISEFRVFGNPGSTKRVTPHTPDVAVANKAEVKPTAMTPSTATTLDAYCTEWIAKVTPAIHDYYEVQGNYPGPIAGPYCMPQGAEVRAAGSLPSGIASVFTFGRTTLESQESVLAFLTPAGMVVAATLDAQGHQDPHCGGYTASTPVSARVVQGGVLVSWQRGSQSNAFPSEGSEKGGTYSSVETIAVFCKPSANGELTCSDPGSATFGAATSEGALTSLFASYRAPVLLVGNDGSITTN